ARLDRVLLIVAIQGFLHSLKKEAALICGQQFVPIRAPDDFDNVPARSLESRFEFLDDFAIAAHRTIEPLQIAIDDPGQIVEVLASGQGERSESFGFIGLAVANESPNPGFLALKKP